MGIFLIFFRICIYVFRGIRLCYHEIILEWQIIRIRRTNITLIFIFDFFSIFFLRTVILISGSVILYRTNYIIIEVYYRRFLNILFLFVLSIFLLILRPNLIRLLLGWDGLGVSSYLLVIYYQSSKSFNAGIITALTNRLGDVGLLILIGLIINYGDWTFAFMNNGYIRFKFYFLIILIISACTKRAQIPFSAWLPAAIAAPTPVSALVHSSTLVTAGVYLLIRFNYLLSSFTYSFLLIYLGIITILIAGIVAILETDIKKVIALSTLSQLGVIIIVLGFNLPILRYFHLLCHAYFKAILFICAGIIIHNMIDYQDIRNIGSIILNIPIIRSIINIANLRLCGLPFLRGFYSKDIILEIIIIGKINLFTLFLILFGTIFTILYSARITFLLRLNNTILERINLISDKSFWIILGIINLLPFSIIGGWNLENFLMSSSSLIYLPIWLKSSISIVIMISLIILRYYYIFEIKIKKSIIRIFFLRIWFLPNTYRNTSSKLVLKFRKIMTKEAEIFWSEYILFKKYYLAFKNFWIYLDSISNIFYLNSLFLFIFLVFL